MFFAKCLPQQYYPYPGQEKLAASQDLAVPFSMHHIFFLLIGTFSVSVEYYSESFSKSVSVMHYFRFGYEVVGLFFGGLWFFKKI